MNCIFIGSCHTVKAVGFCKDQFLDHYVLNTNQPVLSMAQHLCLFYFNHYFLVLLSDEVWVFDWLIDIFCEHAMTHFKWS